MGSVSNTPALHRPLPCTALVRPSHRPVLTRGRLVLLVLQRAKRGGFLEGLDLQHGLYSELQRALVADGAASLPPPETPETGHGLLSILHPWSSRLEELDLDAVTRALA